MEYQLSRVIELSVTIFLLMAYSEFKEQDKWLEIGSIHDLKTASVWSRDMFCDVEFQSFE